MRRCLNCMEEYPDQYESCPHCGFISGAVPDSSISLPPGSILQGRYIVGTIIKIRETDIFYIGWDALFNRKVEIQEYFPRYCATRSDSVQISVYDSKQELFEAGKELFIRHSRNLIRLYEEEDVITFHACFTENRTAYAIMDYRETQTLDQYLEGRTIRVQEAKEWIFKAARAVEKAHEIGIYHGYVGLDSFWTGPGGRLILKDFGAARYISGEPGIIDYGRAGFGTDVYGLARMFCRLITGEEIEDQERLEAELLRLQTSLKRTDTEALKAALRHQTNTVSRFCQGLQGERCREISRPKEPYEKSLDVPRWVKGCALLALLAIIGFTGLVATGAVQMKFRQGQSRVEEGKVRVRNITGKNADDMEKELERDGLKMEKVQKEFRKDMPQNTISYQSLKEGSQVPRGTVMKVWISMGPEKAVVPQVVGQSRDDAVKLLKEAGFTNIIIKDSQAAGAYDRVLDISMEQGSNAELDQEITLTICTNEYSGDPRHQGKIPLVKNKDREEARRLLEKEDFRVNWAEEYSDQPEGMVLDQEPKSGEMANKGSYVTVHVSKGPEHIYMKNLELLTREAAEAAVTDMGLKIGEVTLEYSDSVAEGKVIRQGVPQDTEVKKGDEVTLVVSRGEKPAEIKKAEEESKQKEAEAAAESQRQAEAAAGTQSQQSAAEGQGQQSGTQTEGQSQQTEAQSQPETTAETLQAAEENMPKNPVETGQAPTGGTQESVQEHKRLGPGDENTSE